MKSLAALLGTMAFRGFCVLLGFGFAIPAGASPASDCSSNKVELMMTGCANFLAHGARETARNRAIAYNNLGQAYEERQGDYARAIDSYTQALALDPRYVNAYVNRGRAYRRTGENEKAVADFSKALDLRPDTVSILQDRAAVRINQRDAERAIDDLSAAIRLTPDDAVLYASRAEAYAQKAAFGLARDDYDKAIALDPDSPILPGKRRAVVEAMRPAMPVFDNKPVPPESAPAPVTTAPAAEGRLALVIGNAAYGALPKLDSPRHDAEDVAAALTELGFQVVLTTDADRDTMEDRLAAFAKAARRADVALIYYAGHGLQFDNANFLVPVDARLDDETDLRRLVPLRGVIEDLENAPRVRLLILDSARDTGALQRLVGSAATRGAAAKRGLARADAEGTFIVYSTQAGGLADEHLGARNSPFTAALLRHLPEPGVDVRVLFTRVRGDVVRTTDGAQNPEVSDSLVGEFAFR